MVLTISDRNGLLNRDLRHFIDRRLKFALNRFGRRISQIDVVVSDQIGSRGGANKCCRVLVRMPQAKTVVVSETDSDLASCILRVADRTVRAVIRSIGRWQQVDRCKGVIPLREMVSIPLS